MSWFNRKSIFPKKKSKPRKGKYPSEPLPLANTEIQINIVTTKK